MVCFLCKCLLVEYVLKALWQKTNIFLCIVRENGTTGCKALQVIDIEMLFVVLNYRYSITNRSHS